jgi:hypothetical protein
MLVELLRDNSFAGCPLAQKCIPLAYASLTIPNKDVAHAHSSKPHDAGSPVNTQGIKKCIQIHLTGHLSWQEAEMMRRPKLFGTAIEVPYEFRATG